MKKSTPSSGSDAQRRAAEALKKLTPEERGPVVMKEARRRGMVEVKPTRKAKPKD